MGRGLCGWVWGWWVGVGRSWFILEGRCFEVGRSVRLRVWGWWVEVHLGLELVGRGGSEMHLGLELVGRGWSVVAGA